MVKIIGILAAAASLLVTTAALGGPYMEQFTNGSAGWQAPTVNNSGGVAMPNATFRLDATYSGCISAPLSQGPDRLFGFQPPDTRNYQDLTGLALTADFLLTGGVTGPAMPMVRFYVGTWTGGTNYFVSNDAFSWNPNASADWMTHQVELLSANFIEWPNQASHSKTFDQVIAAPDDIGLVFSGAFTSNSTLGFSGWGTVMLDNFGAILSHRHDGDDDSSELPAVPEPATLAFLAAGGAWLLTWRRRKN
jgi:hypothetical protein